MKKLVLMVLSFLFICQYTIFGDGGFVWNGYESSYENKQEKMEMIHPLLKDDDRDCRLYAAQILALLGDEKSKKYFTDIVMLASKSGTIEVDENLPQKDKEKIWEHNQYQRELAFAGLMALANLPCPEYAEIIAKLWSTRPFPKNSLINENEFLLISTAYRDFPKVQKLLKEFEKKFGPVYQYLDE